ncbi:hypothetical protein NEFER03_0811 [Nematocida sp. LUAm3]|nr:hypothetical protein NEFER03_0811 [Nematocida sp. LUAm3]KAI5174829.1 hypothetical protein NEFER02_0929 [Nematocida sp. LUAm2]KAI5177573.1 hypothetical protein NEFER01_0823 [Nematocida sp. LUAm1]
MQSREPAHVLFPDGKFVWVHAEAQREKALVIEKKEKVRGTTKLSPLYKVKTISGNIQWVPEASLEEIKEEEKDMPPAYSSFSRVSLSFAFRELLVKEPSLLNKRVSSFPDQISANHIFNLFFEAQRDSRPHCIEEIKEAVEGLKELFLFSVHTSILYKEERPYYLTELHPNTEKILEACGLTHILRMFLVLPELQGSFQGTPEAFEQAIEYIKLFLLFLENNHHILLKREK